MGRSDSVPRTSDATETCVEWWLVELGIRFANISWLSQATKLRVLCLTLKPLGISVLPVSRGRIAVFGKLFLSGPVMSKRRPDGAL